MTREPGHEFQQIKPITMQEAGRIRVERMLSTYGCIPPSPDGSVIPEFGALAFAQACEWEMERCRMVGWPKMTIHMDLLDAWRLCQFLRVAAAKLRREA